MRSKKVSKEIALAIAKNKIEIFFTDILRNVPLNDSINPLGDTAFRQLSIDEY